MADKAPITPEVTMSASDVRKQFSEVVNRVARSGDRVLVEKHGAPAAMLISMEDVRRLRDLDRRTVAWKQATHPIERIPVEEWEREVARAFDEDRTERQSKRGVVQTAT